MGKFATDVGQYSQKWSCTLSNDPPPPTQSEMNVGCFSDRPMPTGTGYGRAPTPRSPNSTHPPPGMTTRCACSLASHAAPQLPGGGRRRGLGRGPATRPAARRAGRRGRDTQPRLRRERNRFSAADRPVCFGADGETPGTKPGNFADVRSGLARREGLPGCGIGDSLRMEFRESWWRTAFYPPISST